MMTRLVFVVLCAVFLVACNDKKDTETKAAVINDPLAQFSVATSVEFAPTDGKLPADLWPPQ